MYISICMHACMRTYTHIHAHIHTCIHTYIHRAACREKIGGLMRLDEIASFNQLQLAGLGMQLT